MQLMKFISQLVICNILKLGDTTLLDAVGALLGLMVSNLTMKKRVQEWYRWCSRIVKHDEPTNYLTEQETPTIGPWVPQKCLRIFWGTKKHDPCRSHLNLQLWIWAVLKRVTSKHWPQKLCLVFSIRNYEVIWAKAHADLNRTEVVLAETQGFRAQYINIIYIHILCMVV